jgi:hypothetical protein
MAVRLGLVFPGDLAEVVRNGGIDGIALAGARPARTAASVAPTVISVAVRMGF